MEWQHFVLGRQMQRPRPDFTCKTREHYNSLLISDDMCYKVIGRLQNQLVCWFVLGKLLNNSGLYSFPQTSHLLNIYLLEVNFDKSTIKLHLLLISFTLAKFLEN